MNRQRCDVTWITYVKRSFSALGEAVISRILRNLITGRSESTQREILREISRNNVESSERISGVFSKMAASVSDVVWLKYREFEKKQVLLWFLHAAYACLT